MKNQNSKMKKPVQALILISLLMLLMSCSSEIKSSSINPPSWTVGTWTDSTGTLSYTFTSDDMIMNGTGVSVDMKEAISSHSGTTNDETISGDSYKFKFAADEVSATYTFVKTSATTLDYTISENGVSVGPIELIKE